MATLRPPSSSEPRGGLDPPNLTSEPEVCLPLGAPQPVVHLHTYTNPYLHWRNTTKTPLATAQVQKEILHYHFRKMIPQPLTSQTESEEGKQQLAPRGSDNSSARGSNASRSICLLVQLQRFTTTAFGLHLESTWFFRREAFSCANSGTGSRQELR
ncbi:hypothetical protein BKA67DRAFT_529708 [Truncatella angustata]|uniref:Uncharacterized protein n=1 Tax=Truncatella angustata TaxID=152316 RepID=A0A9P8UWP9_9PEZI|nr:uncharacterized protein BKA67DRAFT_529708 [Truncatella angustata]KAH6659565.1 hypothetical protein BKA67DRAFT_529708 [Truncatella angustata]